MDLTEFANLFISPSFQYYVDDILVELGIVTENAAVALTNVMVDFRDRIRTWNVTAYYHKYPEGDGATLIGTCNLRSWQRAQRHEYTRTPAEGNGETETRVGCDPSQRTFMKQNPEYQYNSMHMLISAVLLLAVVVSILGYDHRPTARYPSNCSRNASVASFCMGIMTSLFVFFGGVSFEVEKTRDGSNQTWAGVYFAMSYLTMRHSFYLLKPTVLKRKKRGGTKSTCTVGSCLDLFGGKNPRCCPVRWLKAANKLKKDLTKASGKYYTLFMLVREIFETIVQLIGIDHTARYNDVGAVLTRSVILSLNLICLPTLTLFLFVRYGTVHARVGGTLLEKIFDRLFVVVGIVYSVQSALAADTDETASSLWTQFARHGPVLLPLIIFLRKPQSSLAKFVEWGNAQHRDEAARTIQHFVRCRLHASRPHWSNLLHQMGALDAGAKIQSSRRSHRLTQLLFGSNTSTTHVGSTAVVALAGAISFVAGVLLWAYVWTTAASQQARCTGRIGPLAECLRPRIYFAKDGFLGDTSCAFHLIEAINCSHAAALRQTRHLPEAPEAYAAMVKLTRIDVSDNPLLQTVPESWAFVPELRRIDVSFSSAFHGIPFKVCNAPGLDALNLTGTLAEVAIDWSGQLTNFSTGHAISMSPVCTKTLATSLRSLNLSRNGLDCAATELAGVMFGDQSPIYPLPPKSYPFWSSGMTSSTTTNADNSRRWQQAHDSTDGYFCDFQSIVTPLANLEMLDLSHNALRTVQSGFTNIVDPVILNAAAAAVTKGEDRGGVLLAGNPVVAVALIAKTDSLCALWVQTLSQAGLTNIEALLLMAVTGPMDATWRALQAAPFLGSLIVMAIRTVDMGSPIYTGLHGLRRLQLLSIDSVRTGVNLGWLADLPQLVSLRLGRNAPDDAGFLERSGTSPAFNELETGYCGKTETLAFFFDRLPALQHFRYIDGVQGVAGRGCSAVAGRRSAEKAHFWAYKEQVFGKCTDAPGWGYIEKRQTCQYADMNFSLSTDSAGTVAEVSAVNFTSMFPNHPDVPRGCSRESTSPLTYEDFWFNRETRDRGIDCNSGWHGACICKYENTSAAR